MLNLTVEILHLVIPGPSTHKTDEFGAYLRYRKTQDMDAAPRRRYIRNCRTRNRNETKKHILNEDDKKMCLLIGKPHNKQTTQNQSTSQIENVSPQLHYWDIEFQIKN